MNNFINCASHTYTLCVEGMKIRTKTFRSRPEANAEMYSLIGKHGLTIKEVYNDKHFKTYICSNGIRFHINRD